MSPTAKNTTTSKPRAATSSTSGAPKRSRTTASADPAPATPPTAAEQQREAKPSTSPRSKTPAKTTTRKPVSTKVAPAPEPETIEAEISGSAPAPAKRGPYKVTKVNKRAQTFRLPEDVFELIRTAQEEASARGDKLSNDDVVIQAVRSYWGRRRRRS